MVAAFLQYFIRGWKTVIFFWFSLISSWISWNSSLVKNYSQQFDYPEMQFVMERQVKRLILLFLNFQNNELVSYQSPVVTDYFLFLEYLYELMNFYIVDVFKSVTVNIYSYAQIAPS